MKGIIVLVLLGCFCVSSVSGQTVYKTPSGKKYHLSTCRMVENVSEEITIEQARQSGLEPCKICRPDRNSSTSLPQKKAKGSATTVQCRGYTKAGTRCKHRTSIADGYCYQHRP